MECELTGMAKLLQVSSTLYIPYICDTRRMLCLHWLLANDLICKDGNGDNYEKNCS